MKKMPKTVWALGLVSLFMDTSSEMIHGLLPLFLVSSLGASYALVGIIDGLSEALSLFLKVISGPLSDRIGKRKPLVLLGYSMAAISKPLFALALSPFLVLGARLFDRAGKGIRGAPRDALIADVTPVHLRGEAFGLRQSLDTVGAIIGPLLAMALMLSFSGDYRLVFWVAVIPALLSVLALVFAVKEPEVSSNNAGKRLKWSILRELSSAYWLVAVLGGVLQMARFSEAFLILRAENLGLAENFAPLVLVVMNVVYSLSSYPAGWLADRVRRDRIVLIGFLLLVLADTILALASNLPQVWAGVIAWGLHMGLTQGVLAALIADASPPEYRGTAFGIFNFISAIALLVASAVTGLLWDHYGPTSAFMYSAVVAVLGTTGLLFVRKSLVSST